MEYQRGNVQRQSIGTIDHQGGNNKGVLLHGKIRKLTPKECWRLMGFTDEEFEKASQVNSNTQLYKQARKFNSCKCANRNI
jgi:DNA (cytosine-5)-methyltransferase 1